MNRRLLQATRANDTDMIEEVMSLMLEVKRGWDGIRDDYLTHSGNREPLSGYQGENTHISA